MGKTNKTKVINNIKIILFFMYLLIFYMFGADVEKVKYSEVLLLLFIGLEFLDVVRNK